MQTLLLLLSAVVVRGDHLGTVHTRAAAVRRYRPVRDGHVPTRWLSIVAASQLPERSVSVLCPGI